MPGGRLTLSERRYVAEALALGLGYAEIARRLHRPTSTISREVARNGGRDAYEAAASHRSTGERARRVSAVRRREPDADRQDAVIADFRRRYTEMMIEIGMPPMPARIIVSLLTSEPARQSAAELVRVLRVSPASVSKGVAYLETLGMLRRDREPGTRRETYFVDDNMWARAWLRAIEFQARWARAAAEGARLLGPGTAAGERLAEMAEFSELMNVGMARELDRHRAEFDRRRAPS